MAPSVSGDAELPATPLEAIWLMTPTAANATDPMSIPHPSLVVQTLRTSAPTAVFIDAGARRLAAWRSGGVFSNVHTPSRFLQSAMA